MINPDKLKVVSIVVVLLAALAVFDAYSGYVQNQVTGAVIIYDKDSGTTYPDSVTGVLNEGKSKVYTLSGRKTFDVSADFVSSTSAKLTVEGEVTPSLGEGDSYALKAGAAIKVLKLTVNNSAGGKRKVTFTLSAIAPCIDSDKEASDSTDDGVNYYEYGTVTFNPNSKGYQNGLMDSCSGKTLEERYCDIQGSPQTSYYDCPTGCMNGACLPNRWVTTDSLVNGILNERETKIIYALAYTSLGGKDFEVTVASVDFAGTGTVIFNVNGQLTHLKENGKERGLKEGESYTLADGSTITVRNILTQKGGKFTVVFTLATFSPQPQAATASGTEIGGINIAAGWNIVGVGTLSGIELTTCDKSKVSKTIYAWNNAKNDYDVCQLSDDLDPGQCVPFERAAWLYNGGEKCLMNSRFGLVLDQKITLGRGWNQLAVQPQWNSKGVEEFIPESCGFKVGWAFSQNEGYRQVSNIPEDVHWPFPYEKYGHGFWAYVDNPCSFN